MSSTHTTTSAPVTAASATVTAPPGGPTQPEGVTFHTEEGTAGPLVFANFQVHDDLTNGFIKRGAQMETVDILKYARSENPDAAQVVIQRTFQTKDTYGNTHPDTIVLNVRYDQSTLQKINLDGINTEDIWHIRDGGMIHPNLQ